MPAQRPLSMPASSRRAALPRWQDVAVQAREARPAGAPPPLGAAQRGAARAGHWRGCCAARRTHPAQRHAARERACKRGPAAHGLGSERRGAVTELCSTKVSRGRSRLLAKLRFRDASWALVTPPSTCQPLLTSMASAAARCRLEAAARSPREPRSRVPKARECCAQVRSGAHGFACTARASALHATATPCG